MAASLDGQASDSNSLNGVLDEFLQLYLAKCDEQGIGNSIDNVPDFLLTSGRLEYVHMMDNDL